MTCKHGNTECGECHSWQAASHLLQLWIEERRRHRATEALLLAVCEKATDLVAIVHRHAEPPTPAGELRRRWLDTPGTMGAGQSTEGVGDE